MKFFWTFSIGVLMAQAAQAECHIWSHEDTSHGGQRRARVFVSTQLEEHDLIVAQAFAVASQIAWNENRDFVDIFMTRPQNGTDRAKHSLMTSMVQLRYNPGGTPVIKGTLEAKSLPSGAKAEWQEVLFIEPHEVLDETQIKAIVDRVDESLIETCS